MLSVSSTIMIIVDKNPFNTYLGHCKDWTTARVWDRWCRLCAAVSRRADWSPWKCDQNQIQISTLSQLEIFCAKSEQNKVVGSI